MNLQKLSEKELIKLRQDVDKALSGMEKKKREDARKAAEAAAKKHGFSLNDLVGGKPAIKKQAKPAKYRNPDNPDQTWSGRGRQPVWFKEAVAKGVSEAKLSI